MGASSGVSPAEHLLCRCYRVTEETIRRAIRETGLQTVEQVTACTRAAGGCSSCYDDIQIILDEIYGTKTRAVATASVALSDAQRRPLIEKAIEEDMRRLCEVNGVRMELLDVQADRVFTRFHGRNVGTTLPSVLTLKWYLVRIMSAVCGHKMQQIETNVLESQGSTAAP